MENKNIIYGCVFCEPQKNLIITETNNFIVLYDPYPLIQGHIMISTKEHFGCAGEIPDHCFLELQALKATYSKKTKDNFGSVSLYEHGRAGVCHAKDIDEADPNSCNHFHLHILPISENINEALKKNYTEYKISDLTEIPHSFYKYGNYLFFQNSQGQLYFYAVENKTVPPHFIRTLIAQAIGTPERADWEKMPLETETSLMLVKNI